MQKSAVELFKSHVQHHNARGSVSTVVRTTSKVYGKGQMLAPRQPETP